MTGLLEGEDASLISYTFETLTQDGVTYINDSKGTNPDSTIKAVETMDRPTVLLLGGYDKGGSFDALFQAFTPNIRHTVLLGATAARLKEAAEKNGWHAYSVADGTFQDAVLAARAQAKDGWNVLLSPACASFDMFTDFEERGRVFKDIVNHF